VGSELGVVRKGPHGAEFQTVRYLSKRQSREKYYRPGYASGGGGKQNLGRRRKSASRTRLKGRYVKAYRRKDGEVKGNSCCAGLAEKGGGGWVGSMRMDGNPKKVWRTKARRGTQKVGGGIEATWLETEKGCV